MFAVFASWRIMSSFRLRICWRLGGFILMNIDDVFFDRITSDLEGISWFWFYRWCQANHDVGVYRFSNYCGPLRLRFSWCRFSRPWVLAQCSLVLRGLALSNHTQHDPGVWFDPCSYFQKISSAGCWIVFAFVPWLLGLWPIFLFLLLVSHSVAQLLTHDKLAA